MYYDNMIFNRAQTIGSFVFSCNRCVMVFGEGEGEEGATYEFKNINNNTYLHIIYMREKKPGLRLFRLIYVNVFEKTKSPEWKQTGG